MRAGTSSRGTSTPTVGGSDVGEVPGEMPQARKRSSSSSRLSGARDRAIEARHAVPAARLPETAARDGGSFQARFYFCPVTAN